MKLKVTIPTIIVIFGIVMHACTNDNPGNLISGVKGTFTDERDGTTYQTITLDGKRWFAEDLAYQGKSEYTHNEALQSCPKGWHLATDLEWGSMILSFGGYININEPVGQNLTGAYDQLISHDLLKAVPDQLYWSADPIWGDAWTISSVAYFFEPQNTTSQTERSPVRTGAIRTSTLACRCVQGEKNNGSFIAVTYDDKENMYDLKASHASIRKAVDNTFGFGMMAFDTLRNDWVDNYAYITFPSDQTPLIFPAEITNGTIEIGTRDELGIWINRHSLSNSGQSTISITINSWNKRELSGQVTGFFAHPDTVEIDDADFLIKFNN